MEGKLRAARGQSLAVKLQDAAFRKRRMLGREKREMCHGGNCRCRGRRWRKSRDKPASRKSRYAVVPLERVQVCDVGKDRLDPQGGGADDGKQPVWQESASQGGAVQ